jgi:hypothetical protein
MIITSYLSRYLKLSLLALYQQVLKTKAEITDQLIEKTYLSYQMISKQLWFSFK